MSRLGGVEEPLHAGDGVGRGHADRLVEHQPAVDLAALVAPRHQLSSLVARRDRGRPRATSAAGRCGCRPRSACRVGISGPAGSHLAKRRRDAVAERRGAAVQARHHWAGLAARERRNKHRRMLQVASTCAPRRWRRGFRRTPCPPRRAGRHWPARGAQARRRAAGAARVRRIGIWRSEASVVVSFQAERYPARLDPEQPCSGAAG